MVLERYAFIGLSFSVIIIFTTFYLIKKRKIDSSTFVLWFIIGVTIGVFSIIPSFSFILFKFIGTEALISAITAVGFFFLLIIVLYLHVIINDLKDKVLKLTVKVTASELNFEKEHEEKN